MESGMRATVFAAMAISWVSVDCVRAQSPLPDTAPLTMQGDLSAQMIAGIGRFLERETVKAAEDRAAYWKANLSGDVAAYEKSVQPNRQRLAEMIGVIDPRIEGGDVQFVASVAVPAKVAETDRFTAF